MNTRFERMTLVFAGAVFVSSFFFIYFSPPRFARVNYYSPTSVTNVTAPAAHSAETDYAPEPPPKPVFTATHIQTPDAVKAVYMTQCVAGTPRFRDRLVALIEATELNSLVIDIKDFSGGIGFIPDDPALAEMLSTRCYAADIRSFIKHLHEKNIYVIGRITVFQDPIYAKLHPELAVRKESDDSLWQDYKKIAYIDPGARDMWEYMVTLSREAYLAGFDELNFDYVRFPSDGNMRDIYYPFSEERVNANPDTGKAEVLREFFSYLHENLTNPETYAPKGNDAIYHPKLEAPILSADLFGMTTTNRDDLNVGQILEYALPYFDYIAPMVYPSHYPKNFNGHEKPATVPYEVVHFSMQSAVERIKQLEEYGTPTTTPSTLTQEECVSCLKLRPWLQDFNLGAIYTPEMVRAQMQATYDAGLTSWMLWDAANTYTREALVDAGW